MGNITIFKKEWEKKLKFKSKIIIFQTKTYLHGYRSERYNCFASYSDIFEQQGQTFGSEHAEGSGPSFCLGYCSNTSSSVDE